VARFALLRFLWANDWRIATWAPFLQSCASGRHARLLDRVLEGRAGASACRHKSGSRFRHRASTEHGPRTHHGFLDEPWHRFGDPAAHDVFTPWIRLAAARFGNLVHGREVCRCRLHSVARGPVVEITTA